VSRSDRHPSPKFQSASGRGKSTSSANHGLRLFGWLDPNPDSTKYDFGERAYSSRDGLFHARLRYRMPGDPRVRTEADLAAESAEELLEVARDAQIELTKKLRLNRMPSEIRERETSFKDGLVRYRNEHLTQRKPSALEKEVPQINKWLVPFLGRYTLAELKLDGRQIGRAWVSWMRSEQSVTWKTSTGIVRREQRRAPAGHRVATQALEIARAILTVYRDEFGLLDFDINPFAGVKVAKRADERVARHLEEAIPLELVETVAFFMEDLQDVALTLALGELGLRQQEAYVLDWSDVLWREGAPRSTIFVRQAVSGNGRNRSVGDTKSLSAVRQVTVHEPSADVFHALWIERGRPPIEPGSRVFPGKGTTSRGEKTDGILNRPGWKKWKFDPAFAALFSPAEFEKLEERHGDLTPHRLRSAAASAAGYAGLSRAEAMLNFGWTREDTMIQHYERAYQDRDPQLRGLPVAGQIAHARRRVLEEIPALKLRLATEVEAQRKRVEAAVSSGAAANDRRSVRAQFRHAEKLLARVDLMEERLRMFTEKP
jgi:hypothetical protein